MLLWIGTSTALASPLPSVGALARDHAPEPAVDPEAVEERAAARADEADDLQIEAAHVDLAVYRGGEARPDGETIPRKGAWVQGEVTYALARPAREGETLVLLNFAESMPEEPTELVETALETYIDGPFDPGALILEGYEHVQGVTRAGPHRDVVVTLPAGATSFTLRYAVDVPKRYWPFGCVERRCSLSGAIAPLPSVPARGGRYLPEGGRVVAPVRWTVGSAALAGDPTRRPGAKPDARTLARPYEVVVVGGDGSASEYPSVFWGPRWFRATTIHRGVSIEVLHMLRRPSAQVPDERFVQLRRDLPGHVVQISREMIDLVTTVVRPQTPGSAITVVQGPLRSQVAEYHPDAVLVSDQALQIFPSERFTKFHLMVIARAVADMLMQREFRGTHDPSTDAWLHGTLGFALATLWRRARDTRDEFAADILRNLTFMPAVDRFLYTQQASFSQSYFRGVDDAPELRNHPLWFSHELPTGRRIHEKLSDTAGPEALDGFYRRLTKNPRVDPIDAAERAWGRSLGWFFDQWLGPYPSVDYLVKRVDTQRVGEGWAHEIEIARNGERTVIEPVQVLVTERGGKTHHLIWNGQVRPDAESLDDEPRAGSHVFSLHTTKKIKSVRLDPRSRLVQIPQAPHDNVDPRFNDRHPPLFRFLYTGAGFSLAASEFLNANTVAARFNAVTGFASFEGSLRRDLRATGHAQIFRDRETVIGGGIATNAWFGGKVNNQRRRARVRVGLTTSLLNAQSLDPRGGLRFIERVALVDDTRRFGWWPARGRLLSVGVSARHTLRVDGEGTDDRHDVIAGASWTQLWPIAYDHVIATSIGTDILVPIRGEPEFRGLLRAGGIGGLSGYSADEIFGRASVLALLEYRHVYVRDLDINFAHLAYLRALAGTISTGVATMSSCDSYRGWFGKESYYAHVGYSLGGYLSILGVTPQLTKLELSVPLVRRSDVQCLGQTLPDYLAEVQGLPTADPLLPPFSLNLTFGQNF